MLAGRELVVAESGVAEVSVKVSLTVEEVTTVRLLYIIYIIFSRNN